MPKHVLLRELVLLLQDPKRAVPYLLKQPRKPRVLLLLKPQLRKERKVRELKERKVKRVKKATEKRPKKSKKRRKKKRSRL